MYLFTQQLYIFKQIKGYKKMYMTVHTFIIGFCTCKSILLLTEFYVVINKTDKTLICVYWFFFYLYFNDIWHFVDWIHFIGIAWFFVLYLPVIFLLSSKPTISHREHFSVRLVCVYTCIAVIDKVLLRKEVRQKGTD